MFGSDPNDQGGPPPPVSPGGISPLLAAILAQQLFYNGQHPGPQVQDGPVGENAQLGWGTAPEMQYPQAQQSPWDLPQQAMPIGAPPADFATAAHQRPATSHGPQRPPDAHRSAPPKFPLTGARRPLPARRTPTGRTYWRGQGHPI